MAKRFNNPNWFQAVSCYMPGAAEVIAEFTIEQVWDGSLAGHRRLRRQCIEQVERMRDSDRLEYVLWGPVTYGGVDIPLADRPVVNVS